MHLSSGRAVAVLHREGGEVGLCDDADSRRTFNGYNTNSDGTERAAFVVITPPELKDVFSEKLDCGVVVAWAEHGRYIVDDEPEGKHVPDMSGFNMTISKILG